LYWSVTTDDFAPSAGEPLSRATRPAPPARGPRQATIRVTIDAGAIAAAATGGVVAGFGLHRGGMLEPFAAAGRRLLDIAPTETGAARPMALAAGVLAHIGCAMLWAILFGALAGRARGARLLVFALCFAAVGTLVDRRILPVSLRLGHGMDDGVMQTFMLYIVLTLALMVGMRLAQLVSHGGSRSPAMTLDDDVDA
jgi:hypothetical protein